MGVVLPDELAWVLDLIGIEFPNVDEDDYREMADALRAFADKVEDGQAATHKAIQRYLSAHEGLAAQAFEAHWQKLSGTHLANLGEAARIAAVALDGVAVAIAGAKGAAVVQLGVLAAEVATAQAAAPITLGLSELGALGATQATRVIVRKLLREAEQLVVEELMALVSGPVFAALGGMASDLVLQLGANAVGLKDGFDLKEAAATGASGFQQGVADGKAQVSGLLGGGKA